MANKLTEKQGLFCKAYYTIGSETFGNGTESAKIAGYKGSDKQLSALACENKGKPSIIARSKEIQAVTAEILDYNREIALKQSQLDYDRLETQAELGNVQAINARLAIRRELAAISNMHSQVIVDKKDITIQPTDAEQEIFDDATRTINLKLAKGAV